MHLLAPIWLTALVALSIPVVIHLWQIKQGKTLKVGSIALFSESSPKSSRSFKLADLLLLVLRCLLLAALALVLTMPFWQHRVSLKKTVGWVLIPGSDFKETYNKFKPAIDSLTNRGYELHSFGPGFKRIDTLNNDTTAGNYWQLLTKLNDTLSPAVPVELFAANNLNNFEGAKPQTNLKIHWCTYMPADSAKNWIAGAWLTAKGTIRVARGTAILKGTAYQYDDLKNGEPGADYDLSIENGVPVINLKNQPSAKIKIDTTTQRMAIYTDKNNADAGYLSAALYAIAGLTQQKTVVKLYNSADLIPAGQHWLFWLTEKPYSDIETKTKNLLSYAGGKSSKVTSWMINTGLNTKVELYKEVPAQMPAGEALWVDGFGNPVLSLTQGGTNNYKFYSRFNPAWNDLVWNDEFPRWLLELTLHRPVGAGKYERRAISAAQLQTGHLTNEDIRRQPANANTDLSHYLWLLLAMLFFAERWLSTKNDKITVNG